MLAEVGISTLSSTLGVSESYAGDIRAGRHRPHPRHLASPPSVDVVELAALLGVP